MKPLPTLIFLAITSFCLFGCSEYGRSDAQDRLSIEPGAYTFDSGDAFEIWRAYLDTSGVFDTELKGLSRQELTDLIEKGFDITDQIEAEPLFDIYEDNSLTTVFLSYTRMLEEIDSKMVIKDSVKVVTDTFAGKWRIEGDTLVLATGINAFEMKGIIKSKTSFELAMEIPGEVPELKTSIYSKK